MFLGAASAYSVTQQAPYEHFHDMEIDGYIQDNYRLNAHLTVNLGLRYEAHPAVWEKYGVMEGFDLDKDAMITAAPLSTLISEGYTTQSVINADIADGAKFESGSDVGKGTGTLLRNYNATFSPRVGFAYQPFRDGGMVIRAAAGQYIYPVPVRSSWISFSTNNPLKIGYSESYISAAQSPDGLPNYLLRAPQQVIMGANSSNVVNSSVAAILPGFTSTSLNSDFPPTFVTQANATLEQPFRGSSVFRLSWVYSHGANLDQYYEYNNHPSSYVYEMRNGIVPPNGSTVGSNQYSTTATGPYDQTTCGSGNAQIGKTGFSNNNALQATYQRLFTHGISYQIIYAWSKPFRIGGNSSRDSLLYPYANYNTSGPSVMTQTYGSVVSAILPPPPPSSIPSYGLYRSLNRFENYTVDTNLPKQHIQFNGIVDLPIGRGKRILGNANKFANELIGGFQVAGDGSIVSQDFAINATNWGPTAPLKVYKHQIPINDCTNGVCTKEYEWFNGYIAPGRIGGNCASATGCVTGLPSDYVPYQTSIDNVVGTKYYGSNEVQITLPGGKPTDIAYSPGPQSVNPFSHTILNGPFNYTVDLSIFKVFPITERVDLRLNVDAFNALNVQGFVIPNTTTGEELLSSSYNTPRQIQISARLSF